MQALVFGFVLLSVIMLGRHWQRLGPSLRAAFPAVNARNAGGVAALVLGAILTMRGMVGHGLTLASLGSFLMWGSTGAVWQKLKAKFAGGSSASGQTSRVVTGHLDMQLDHATGAISGTVLKGVFNGRPIGRMAPAELALLWQDCRFADPQSAQLLETYLDRIHGTWREDMARAEGTPGAGGIMTVAEALEVLGLTPGATADDIKTAHRELMKKMHPDRGGSTYLAAKINEAKDKLLG
jgi:DnaJ domain